MTKAQQVCKELDKGANLADAQFLQRYFKTGRGQYGEGDVFIGLRVPSVRKIAAKYKNLSLAEVEKLLESSVHEHRLTAVIVMAEQAKRSDAKHKKALYDLYLRRTDRINNWDLVDVSCRDVVGGYLVDRPKEPLYKLAKSNDIWERRIAIISTAQFIRAGHTKVTYNIAEMLLGDTHDLIHKAVGWMLREAGKNNEAELRAFLDKYAGTMPRTMLRYSLEKFSPSDREYYMKLRLTKS